LLRKEERKKKNKIFRNAERGAEKEMKNRVGLVQVKGSSEGETKASLKRGGQEEV